MSLRHMMSHEWRLLRAERTVWVVLAVTALLVAYGIWNGRNWVEFQKRTLAEVIGSQQKRLNETKSRLMDLESRDAAFDPNYFRDPRNPRAVNSVYGFQWAVLPPSDLAALAVGQSDLYPYYMAVTAASQHTSAQLDELQNPTQLLAGRFDLAFVAIYLLPLLVFACSYNMLSEERENGTLAMVLAQPATLRSLLIAKIAVRALFVILIAIGLSGVGFAASGADVASSAVLAGVLPWTLTVVAYGLFWLALATLVNATGWTSATNALTLAGLWLALVAIVPSVLNVVISAIHPLPSRIALVEAARDAQNRSQARVSQRTQIDMDQRARSSLMQIMDAEAEVRPILRQFEEQLEKQQASVRRWRILSPAIMTQLALTEIAGTDGSRYKTFIAATEEFRGRWREFLSPIYPRRFTSADLERIPTFAFQEPARARYSFETAWLILAASFACGFAAFALLRRMKPR